MKGAYSSQRSEGDISAFPPAPMPLPSIPISARRIPTVAVGSCAGRRSTSAEPRISALHLLARHGGDDAAQAGHRLSCPGVLNLPHGIDRRDLVEDVDDR